MRLFRSWACLTGTVLALAVLVYAELTAEQRQVREVIRVIFAGETQAERDAAFNDLVALGAQDLELVLWGLEAHNAAFMLAPGRFDELLDRIAAAGGGADAVVAGARNVLAGPEWVGKRCALMALEHFQAPAGSEVAGVVLDTTQPAFLRTQAALTLGRLGGSLALPGGSLALPGQSDALPDMADAVADLSLVLRDSSEPDALRQACAESLAVLDPATLERDATALLADANSSPALARRLNERLTDLGLSAPAQGGD